MGRTGDWAAGPQRLLPHLHGAYLARRDQAGGGAISSRLMRYRDQNGQGWADIIDMLTLYPEARRQVVRLLGEIGAEKL